MFLRPVHEHAVKINPRSPSDVLYFLFRMSFGLSLIFIGIISYVSIFTNKTDAQGLYTFMTSGMGRLEFLGVAWAYIFPLLLIIGGALLVLGMFLWIVAWTAGVGLAVIPAAMFMKTAVDSSVTPFSASLPTSVTAMIWIVALGFILAHDQCTCSECKKK